MKRNITFSFEEDLLARILALSADHGVSANEIVRAYFEHLAGSGLSETRALTGNLKTLFDYSMGLLNRAEARQRLGVSDAILTQMLTDAGFPPPRASAKDEQTMLTAMKDVQLAR